MFHILVEAFAYVGAASQIKIGLLLCVACAGQQQCAAKTSVSFPACINNVQQLQASPEQQP